MILNMYPMARLHRILLFTLCFVIISAVSADLEYSKCDAFSGDSGSAAPAFELEDLNGRRHSLDEYKGKVILLNFWATWCKPCKSEMPSLNMLYRLYKGKSFEIVSVSTDRNSASVKEFFNENKGVDFDVLIDPDSSTMKKYKVFSLPTTFLINREGIIVDKFMGGYEWTASEIKEKIEKAYENVSKCE